MIYTEQIPASAATTFRTQAVSLDKLQGPKALVNPRVAVAFNVPATNVGVIAANDIVVEGSVDGINFVELPATLTGGALAAGNLPNVATNTTAAGGLYVATVTKIGIPLTVTVTAGTWVGVLLNPPNYIRAKVNVAVASNAVVNFSVCVF